MGQTTNQAGLTLIESFEGLRLTSYQDSVGVWTVNSHNLQLTDSEFAALVSFTFNLDAGQI